MTWSYSRPPDGAPTRQPRHPRAAGALAAALVVVVLLYLGTYLGGIDYRPLVWALQLEADGKSAYGPEMSVRFQSLFRATLASGGFAYPLPAMWLALPVVAVPEPAAKSIWCALTLGSVLLGMLLLRLPRPLFLFVPLLWGMSELQSTVLLCGLLLVGIWALRERRWWLLGAMVALTCAAKPQTTLVIAGALAFYAYRARAWRPLALCTLLILVPTFALEPGWVQAWLASAMRYRGVLKTMWMLPWLPVAALLLWRRRMWSGLAVVQMALFPVVTHPYTLLPLLIGYVDLRDRRLAWLAVAGSWASVLVGTIGPLWLFVGLCYLPPLIIDALRRAAGGADVGSAHSEKQ